MNAPAATSLLALLTLALAACDQGASVVQTTAQPQSSDSLKLALSLTGNWSTAKRDPRFTLSADGHFAKLEGTSFTTTSCSSNGRYCSEIPSGPVTHSYGTWSIHETQLLLHFTDLEIGWLLTGSWASSSTFSIHTDTLSAARLDSTLILKSSNGSMLSLTRDTTAVSLTSLKSSP